MSSSSLDEEELLLQNWATSPKQAWFKEAWLFLQRSGTHWWCEHFAVTYHLAELLRHHQQPQVRLIWEAMSEQMACCAACTNSYHYAKALYAEEFEPQAVASLLSAMQLLDAQRLEAWLALASSPLPPGQAPPEKVLSAVFEGLVHNSVMDDAGVCEALVRTLKTLQATIDLQPPTEGGRYPGLYRLLAHPDAATRIMVLPMVQRAGPIPVYEEVAFSLGPLLERWTATLHGWMQVGGLVASAVPQLSQQQQQQQQVHPLLPSGRPASVQPIGPIWLALKVFFQLLEPGAMASILLETPSLSSLLPTLFKGVAVPPVAPVPPPQAAVYRSMLACLIVVLRRLGLQLWQHAQPDGNCLAAPDREEGTIKECKSPAALGDVLMRVFLCVQDEPTQKAVLQAIHALLDAWMEAPVRSQHATYALLGFLRFQVFQCLRVPPLSSLVRSTAAFTALAVMRHAIEAGYSTSFACHIWGQAACEEACHMGPVPAGTVAKLGVEATRLMALVLQVDATALGGCCDPTRTLDSLGMVDHILGIAPIVQDQPHPMHMPQETQATHALQQLCSEAGLSSAPRAHRSHHEQHGPAHLCVCGVGSAWSSQEGSLAAAQQLSNLEAVRCVPAYWSSASQCGAPPVAAALLSGAAHVAGCSTHLLPVNKAASLPLRWQGHVLEQHDQAEASHAVHMQERAPALLGTLNKAAESFLWYVSTPSKHILGPAAATAEHKKAMGAAQLEDVDAEALELSGVKSTLRLSMAIDAGLRTAAVAALSAHLAGRAHTTETKATILEDVLRACLAGRLACVVMDVFSEVLQEVQAKLAHEVLLSPGLASLLASFLEAFAILVLAQADLPPAPAAAPSPPPSAGEGLVARMYALCAKVTLLAHQVLVRSSSQSAWAALPDAQPALQALFRALPGSWYHLLQPLPGQEHHACLSAALACSLSRLLLWGPAACAAQTAFAAPSPAGAASRSMAATGEAWAHATELLLSAAREELGSLPQQVVQAAQQVLSPASGLPDALRVQVAPAVPEATPPSLSRAHPLADLPSASAKPSAASPAPSGGMVVDLTVVDSDEDAPSGGTKNEIKDMSSCLVTHPSQQPGQAAQVLQQKRRRTSPTLHPQQQQQQQQQPLPPQAPVQPVITTQHHQSAAPRFKAPGVAKARQAAAAAAKKAVIGGKGIVSMAAPQFEPNGGAMGAQGQQQNLLVQQQIALQCRLQQQQQREKQQQVEKEGQQRQMQQQRILQQRQMQQEYLQQQRQKCLQEQQQQRRQQQLIVEDEEVELELLDAAQRLHQRQQSRPPLPQPQRPARQTVLLAGAVRGPLKHILNKPAAPPKPALRMDDLHAAILSWDLEKDVLLPYCALSSHGLPQSAGPQRSAKPVSFPSTQQYVDAFRDLLMEELRAGIAAAADELAAGSTSLNCFPVFVKHMRQVNSTQVLTLTAEGASVSSLDLLLLTKKPLSNAAALSTAAAAAAVPDGASSLPTLRTLGLVVEASTSQGTRELQCKVVPPQASSSDRHKLHQTLLPGTTWHATVLHSLTPNMREFQALCNFHLLPDRTRAFLLNPKASRVQAPPPLGSPLASSVLQGSPQLSRILQARFNQSQQVAVASALDARQPFVLVQGPPGTGKTSTILGITSAMLACGLKTSASQPADAMTHMREEDPAMAALQRARAKSAPGGAAPQPHAYKKPSAAARRPGTKAAAGASASSNDAAEGAAGPEGELRLGQVPAVRILICAQSNAAIDELVGRLARDGVWRKTDGNQRAPGMVRLGRSETTHPQVLDYHVDALAERLSGKPGAQMDVGSRHEQARARVEQLRQQIRAAHDELHGWEEVEAKRQQDGKGEDTEAGRREGEAGGSGGDTADRAPAGRESANRNAMRGIRDRLRGLHVDLQEAEKETRSGGRELERAQRELRHAIIRAAELTVCTLNVAGGELAQALAALPHNASGATPAKTATQGTNGSSTHLYDALIIDEAAQALEPAALIPLPLLKPNCRVVLVGDPKQLPPTLLSRSSAAELSQSLFSRLQASGIPVHMLQTQYRMHPRISRFPSSFFYKGALTDGVSVQHRTAPFHSTHGILGPLVVFDIAEGQEWRGKGRGGSLVNTCEAEAAKALFQGVTEAHPGWKGSIALLTPYRAQLSALRAIFRGLLPIDASSSATHRRANNQPTSVVVGNVTIDFSTIDGYQGREADVVILSCVRASSASGQQGGRGVGFLADMRRMNVALTRARSSLWVLCHVTTLQQQLGWTAFIDHAAKEKSLIQLQSRSGAGGRGSHTALKIQEIVRSSGKSSRREGADGSSLQSLTESSSLERTIPSTGQGARKSAIMPAKRKAEPPPASQHLYKKQGIAQKGSQKGSEHHKAEHSADAPGSRRQREEGKREPGEAREREKGRDRERNKTEPGSRQQRAGDKREPGEAREKGE